MLNRYRKTNGDSRLTATGDRGHHSVSIIMQQDYCHLTPSIYRASEACES